MTLVIAQQTLVVTAPVAFFQLGHVTIPISVLMIRVSLLADVNMLVSF